jgi:hypothetical protein
MGLCTARDNAIKGKWNWESIREEEKEGRSGRMILSWIGVFLGLCTAGENAIKGKWNLGIDSGRRKRRAE